LRRIAALRAWAIEAGWGRALLREHGLPETLLERLG
jgi:hypothetical protein